MAMENIIWDSISKGNNVVLSNDSLTASSINNGNSVRATHGKSEGKWYWEITVNNSASTMVGVVGLDVDLKVINVFTRPNSRFYYFNGNKYNEAVAYGATYTTGDTISILLDMDNGTLEFWKNGVSQGVSHTNLKSIGEVFPSITGGASGVNGRVTANFGSSNFTYTMPNGYEAYNFSENNKFLILSNDNIYKYHNGSNWVDIGLTVTEQNFIDNGMDDLSVVPQSAWRELNGSVQVIHYTDNPTQEESVLTVETESFSVYDYISETPEVLVYNESEDDITVETTTEPFTIYDEFGNELEVLYYTDDEAVTEADLILEANWSPIDELEGDFEVVTWTDEPQETAQRVLEMKAIPKPQFIKLVNPKNLYGYLDDVVAVDASQSYRDEVRYLFSGQDTTKWYAWNKKTKAFEQVDASTHELILKNGMKHGDLAELVQDDWRTWKEGFMNIGVFLKDNPRDTITSIVDSLSYQDYLPRHSSTIVDSSLYILNTTAKIDITLDGAVLKGFLSDSDLTRVQYRVLLNGVNYYPANGEFTKLGESPQNIELALKSDSIKIDDWNTIKVEFQDFYGTTDYWQTTFIGTYSGLMFKDVQGQYYSSEAGEVLQYLDFGVIIAGQTTMEHEILLKNQYGYDVKNIHLYANTEKFPQGMSIQFSDSLTPFSPQSELKLDRVLKNNDEMSFFIRLKTDLWATPDANGTFDITVRADKV